MNNENNIDIIVRKAIQIYSEDTLIKKLKSGKKLIVKFGADPSRPDLHLGHTVPLRILKMLQDMGHDIVFVIGDFTAMIGDPSGKSKTRPQLTFEETRKSGETYFKQVTKILDKEKTKIVYNSEWLNKIWKKGYVVIGNVTFDTCAYTARYIMKKQSGDNAVIYSDLNIEKEFSLMSTKPAIGREFYEKNVDYFREFDRIYLSCCDGGLNFRIPRYFMNLLENGYSDDWERIKQNRKLISDNQKDLKMSKTSLSYLEQLEVEEDIKKNRIKSLKRN